MDGISPEVLDSLELFFYAWDPRADTPMLTYHSPSLLLLTGYPLESFRDPHFWLTLIHPEDQIQAEEVLGRLLQGEKCHSIYRLRTRAGDLLWLEDTAIPTVEEGKVVGIQGVIQNITARKHTEKWLQKQNSYLEALNEMTLGVINRLELNELLEVILSRACRLVGTKHGYIYLVSPDGETIEVRAVSGIYAQFLSYRMVRGQGLAGKAWETSKPLVVEDYDDWAGRSPTYPYGLFHAAVAVPLFSSEEVFGIIGTAHLEPEKSFNQEEVEILTRFGRLASVVWDNAKLFSTANNELAERRRTEVELRASRHFVQHILDATPNIITIFDLRENRNVYANRKISTILGYQAEEAQIMDSSLFDALIHPEDAHRVALHLLHMVKAKEGEVREVEYRMKHQDGQWRWLHNRELVFSRDAEGRPAESLRIIEDVTERKASEEALIENEQRYRQLFAAAEHQALELSLLDAVKTAIAREMDLSTIFRAVVEAIARTFGYTLVSLYLLEGEALHVQHAVGYDQIIAEIPTDQGVSGRVARTGNPVLLKDVTTDPHFLKAHPGITSEVCVPLFDQGRVVGTLNVESSDSMRLGEEDLRILTLLAEDIGMAISRARLYEETQASETRQRKWAEELQALYETSLEINAQRDQEALLKAIVQRAVELVGAQMGGLYLLREDSQELELVVSYRLPGDLIGTRLKLGEGLSGRIAQTGRPLMVEDYLNWEGIAPVYTGRPFRRVLGVPMKVGDRVIGVINATDDIHTGSFTQEEIRLVSMFADQAAIALENKRLVAELRLQLAERVRTEQALVDSEERYRELVTSQEEGVIEVDSEETFIYANPSAERFLGVPPGYLPHRSLREFTDPQAFEQVSMQTKARSQGETGHYELWIRRLDGQRRLMRVTSLPRMDDQNHYSGSFSVFEDITERHFAEEELNRLASFPEMNPTPILEVNGEGKVTYMNRVARQRFPDLESSGLRHPFLNGLFSVRSLMKDHGLSFLVRELHVGKSLFQQAINEVQGGDLVRIYALDLTEQKLAEEGLRISEQRYRLLVERSLAGVFRSTPEGRLLDCNDSFARILGYDSREAVLAQPAGMFYQDPKARKALVARLLEEGSLSNIELAIRRKDGTTSWLLENATMIVGDSDASVVMQGTVIDITDRIEAKQKLEQSYKRLRQTLDETVQALASVGEMKDPYTAGHQLHVSQLASSIAQELGFDEERVEGVRVGGLVHDLGKLYVPAEILSKPGKLSQLEFSMIQTHAQAGYEVLKTIQFPWPVAEMALQHHERMNGSGYPRKLKGEEILLEARILAVADVVEAMAFHRPYRPAHGVPKALEEVERGRQEFFDPTVVDACLSLFREKGFQFH